MERVSGLRGIADLKVKLKNRIAGLPMVSGLDRSAGYQWEAHYEDTIWTILQANLVDTPEDDFTAS